MIQKVIEIETLGSRLTIEVEKVLVVLLPYGIDSEEPHLNIRYKKSFADGGMLVTTQ